MKRANASSIAAVSPPARMSTPYFCSCLLALLLFELMPLLLETDHVEAPAVYLSLCSWFWFGNTAPDVVRGGRVIDRLYWE